MRQSCFILLAALCSAIGCATPLQRFEYTAVVMAAEARVVLYAADEATARGAARATIDRMHALEKVMSDYRADSELSHLVAAEFDVPHQISDDLMRVLAAAQHIAKATDGAFDITIRPLTHLWRESRRTGRVPTDAEIAQARRRVDWRMLVLDTHAQTATLKRSEMQLDLGGIGKGFAVDEAMAVLRDGGVTRCLVSLAGDIAVGDPPPGEPAWRISLNGPQTLHLSNAAISTSGDAFQYIIIDDARHSHIIDPRSNAIGLVNQSAIVVIGSNATTADALATALSVLHRDAHAAVLQQFDGVRVIYGEEQ